MEAGPNTAHTHRRAVISHLVPADARFHPEHVDPVYSRYRRIVVAEESGTQLEAVERSAYRGFVAAPLKPGELSAIVKARELWRTRPRLFANDADGFKAAIAGQLNRMRLLDVADVG